MIALLSLECWAKNNTTSVIFLTRDKGCKLFCEESEFLNVVDDLADTLSLIQERNCYVLCEMMEDIIANDGYPDLEKHILDAVESCFFLIDCDVDASSSFYYEYYLGEVEFISAQFENVQPELLAVDYNEEYLVVQGAIEVDVVVTCEFIFSARDGRDMIKIGDATITKGNAIKLDIFLSFNHPNDERQDIIGIEVMSERHVFDFGDLSTDYGVDDPDNVYY